MGFPNVLLFKWEDYLSRTSAHALGTSTTVAGEEMSCLGSFGPDAAALTEKFPNALRDEIAGVFEGEVTGVDDM